MPWDLNYNHRKLHKANYQLLLSQLKQDIKGVEDYKIFFYNPELINNTAEMTIC